VNRLLDALGAQGVLVDADELAIQHWHYVENPARIGANLSTRAASALSVLAARTNARRTAAKYRFAPRFRFRDLLERRASQRTFSEQAVPLAKTLAMLWAAYGIQAKRGGNDATSLHYRTVPSGGGLYPLNLVLVSMKKVRGLDTGIYDVHFCADQSIGFQPISEHWREIFRAFADPGVLRHAQGVVIVVGQLNLAVRKYGNRALLLATLEAGHVAQNALLAATELGIGAVEIAGFVEDRVRKLVRSPDRAIPLTTIVFGEEARVRKQNLATKLEIDFQWIDLESPQLSPSFYLGRARLAGSKTYDYCWGRSCDPLLAYDKAIAESIERLACEQPTGIYRASFLQLRHALDPREVVSYTSDQFSRLGFPFGPFSERNRYRWKDGRDYFSGKTVPVLADLVYFGKKIRKEQDRPYTHSTTSGVAAFASRERALEHAVLELHERDAFMCAWLGRRHTPRIPYRQLPGPAHKRISDLARLGFRVVAKLLSQDPVPVMLVFAQHAGKTFTVLGTAAHYNAEAALDHALAECESMAWVRLNGYVARKIVASQVKRPVDHGNFYAQRKHFRRADFLAEGSAVKHGFSQGTARNWNQLLESLQRRRLRLVSVDITPQGAASSGGAPLQVMRAIVPGLVPVSFGLGTEPLGLPAARKCIDGLGGQPEAGPFYPHPLA
jgi:ribosomal protein S12 methylthiotransferase accessory factor